MNRDLIYFTLSLLALYLVFDQFAGEKRLSRLAETLWQGSGKTTAEQASTDLNLIDIMATAGSIRY